jgi:hypothetical protein
MGYVSQAARAVARNASSVSETLEIGGEDQLARLAEFVNRWFRRSRSRIDSGKQSSDDHRYADQRDNDTHRQHDHRDAEPEPDHDQDEADDHTRRVLEKGGDAAQNRPRCCS